MTTLEIKKGDMSSGEAKIKDETFAHVAESLNSININGIDR